MVAEGVAVGIVFLIALQKPLVVEVGKQFFQESQRVGRDKGCQALKRIIDPVRDGLDVPVPVSGKPAEVRFQVAGQERIANGQQQVGPERLAGGFINVCQQRIGMGNKAIVAGQVAGDLAHHRQPELLTEFPKQGQQRRVVGSWPTASRGRSLCSHCLRSACQVSAGRVGWPVYTSMSRVRLIRK